MTLSTGYLGVGFALAVLGGCTRPSTARGTVLAEVPIVTELQITGAVVGPATGAWVPMKRSYQFEGPEIGAHPAKFELSFETAPATLTGPKVEPRPISTIRGLKIVALPSEWLMTASCNEVSTGSEPEATAVKIGCTVSIAESASATPIQSRVEIFATGDIKTTRGMDYEVTPVRGQSR